MWLPLSSSSALSALRWPSGAGVKRQQWRPPRAIPVPQPGLAAGVLIWARVGSDLQAYALSSCPFRLV